MKEALIGFWFRTVGLGCLGLLASSSPASAGNAFVTDYLNKPARAEAAKAVFNLPDAELTTTESIREAAESASKKRDATHRTPWRDAFRRFTFNADGPKFGDIAAGPFADGTAYKINGVNYDLYLGDNFRVPFQLYFGDLSSSESPEDTNEVEMQDPTQGIAIQFPIAWRYYGRKIGGLCSFEKFDGYCIAGGDITVRSVRLNEVTESGALQEKYIFGSSAALRASVLFPIFPGGNTEDQAGKLALAVGFRHLWHDSQNDDLLFGNLTDPQGRPLRFDGDFSSFTLESEMEIYGNLKIRLEYFKPIDDDDILDDVFKLSFVVAGSKPD